MLEAINKLSDNISLLVSNKESKVIDSNTIVKTRTQAIVWLCGVLVATAFSFGIFSQRYSARTDELYILVKKHEVEITDLKVSVAVIKSDLKQIIKKLDKIGDEKKN